MTDRPIIFSSPMVRAILAGTKTQTRRVAKGVVAVHSRTGEALADIDSAGPRVTCSYGQPGDRLWVRETHMDLGACYLYRADANANAEQERALVAPGQRWRPAIHMPRADSRITLEVTAVRVERLQDISEADAIAEGVEPIPPTGPNRGPNRYRLHLDGGWINAPTAREVYRMLWEQINGTGSWDANPWVWPVEFKHLEGRA